MKHIVFGGDGFTGRYLAQNLLGQGKTVIICDLQKSDLPIYPAAEFVKLDITKKASLSAVSVAPDDMVYHLAARQYHLKVPRRGRQQYFDEVNYAGTVNLLEYLSERGCRNLVFFSTDMIYGKPQQLPVSTDHEKNPVGPYGESKRKAEEVCQSYREKGINITIFRPRLIIGPGRLGILEKLFRLIDNNLPVPIIGDGSNHYQMISVFDCVSAVNCATEKGLNNQEYNLGSKNPPSVEELLRYLIRDAGSKSFLVKTPGSLVKHILGLADRLGVTLMFKEQFLIADKDHVVDISKTEEHLGWTPRYRDEAMICQAFSEYKKLQFGAVQMVKQN